MKTVEELYNHCGLSLGPESRARMEAWLGRAPRGNRLRRSYSLETFGLDEAILRKQFAGYMDAFGVEPEWGNAERNPAIV
jgi:hypothetical protein